MTTRALEQALARHGARIRDGDLPRPDLLLIDGGVGQLRAAQQGLARAGCADLAVVGDLQGTRPQAGTGTAAPRREIRWRAALPPDSAALHLLQRVRDEAHRFAISGHRRRRARRYHESILETVPGSGAGAAPRACCVHFGGLPGVLRAGVADLERVSGIGTGAGAHAI